jgi:hypothetical protein
MNRVTRDTNTSSSAGGRARAGDDLMMTAIDFHWFTHRAASETITFFKRH